MNNLTIELNVRILYLDDNCGEVFKYIFFGKKDFYLPVYDNDFRSWLDKPLRDAIYWAWYSKNGLVELRAVVDSHHEVSRCIPCGPDAEKHRESFIKEVLLGIRVEL